MVIGLEDVFKENLQSQFSWVEKFYWAKVSGW